MQTTTIEPVKELTSLKGQVSKLENAASSLTIASQDDYAAATDLVAQLKDRGSKIKILKESITKPANEILRNTRAMFAPVEAQHANAEAIIKTKLLDYKRQVDAAAREAEAKIAAKVEAGRMRLDTAEKKLDTIERVENTTRGKIGEVQVRTIKKVRIVDAALLPREYLVPDEVAIRRDALGGKTIPGVETYNEDIIAAGRIDSNPEAWGKK